jgi:hypothetical protein
MNKTISRLFLLFLAVAFITAHDLKGTSKTYFKGGVPGSPEFSVDHGFFNSSFLLGISSSNADVRIFYTSDGSNPTINNGILYAGPFLIDKTSVIRAVCVANDNSVSKTTTRTYIFPDDIVHQPNDPMGSPPVIMRWIRR